jgi:hypothetical protein
MLRWVRWTHRGVDAGEPKRIEAVFERPLIEKMPTHLG